MRGRFEQSARRGRKGTPAEVALRMLVLKHLKKIELRGARVGSNGRIDTTVVETAIRYPSGSRLCEDVTQVLCREVERARSAGVAVPRTFRNVRRSVRRRQREIPQLSRRPIARDAKRGALRKPYGRLLAITRRVLRHAAQR